MAIKFTGIGHASFRSKNFKKLDYFYSHILELPRAFDLTDSSGNELSTFYRLPSGQFIEIYHENYDSDDAMYSGDNKQCDRSHYHCCLEIDARHQAYRDMSEKNIPLFKTGDDSVGMCGSWCSFLNDDEGNQWELMEFSPVSKQLIGEENDMKFKG